MSKTFEYAFFGTFYLFIMTMFMYSVMSLALMGSVDIYSVLLAGLAGSLFGFVSGAIAGYGEEQ